MAVQDLVDLGAYSYAQRLCCRHGVSLERVYSRVRTPRVVRARHELIAVLRDTWELSWTEVADVMDLDHTSCLAAYEAHQQRLQAQYGGAA